ncbi:hypothetical protein DFH28DRAFT_1136491 [Melampsora americana]|nr:hypothetical protein DFH28DRAFT_1136491 [Melampsora americana]
MDKALANLCTRPKSDASLYFDQVARYDQETFTAKQSWATIKVGGSLPSPFVNQVLARGQDCNALPGASGNGDVVAGTVDCNALPGGSGNGDVVAGTVSGDQGMEEGMEEEDANA